MISKEIINNLDKIDITEPVPANEPERQYYFIKKAKEIDRKTSCRERV